MTRSSCSSSFRMLALQGLLLLTVVVMSTAPVVVACDKLWNNICFTYAANDDVFWANNCDFSAKDLTSMRGGGDKCGAFCKATPACVRWSWNDYNGGTCYLKAKSQWTLVAKTGVACGFRKFH